MVLGEDDPLQPQCAAIALPLLCLPIFQNVLLSALRWQVFTRLGRYYKLLPVTDKG